MSKKPTVEELRTSYHTKKQLAAWGVLWPPKKGWKSRLLKEACEREGLDFDSVRKGCKTKKENRKSLHCDSESLPPFGERPGIIYLEPPYPAKHPVPSDVQAEIDERENVRLDDEVSRQFRAIIQG